MTSCNHSNLVLLPEKKNRLRCRNCHLTIKPDELEEGYCPECFETNGEKRSDFETIQSDKKGITRYRCEGCRITIECE